MPKLEWEQLQAIAEDGERRLLLQWMQAVAKTATPRVRSEIEAAMKSRQLQKAVDVASVAWESATRTLKAQIAKEVLSIEAKSFTAASGAAAINQSFNLTNAAALRYAETRSSAFAKTLNRDTRAALKEVVTRSFADGVPPREAARQLQQMIGLAPRDAKAIANFRIQLEKISERNLSALSKTAMDRIKRSDQRLFSTKSMDGDRQARMVDAYRARLMRERAMTLVRTETMAAANEGQMVAWRDAARRGQLDRKGKVPKKQWIVTPDDRLCPVCKPMAEQTRRLDELFTSPYNGVSVQNPPIHWMCRCAMGMVWVREDRDAPANVQLALAGKALPVQPVPPDALPMAAKEPVAPTEVYHGTTAKFAEKIVREGLGKNRQGPVWTTDAHGEAVEYSKNASGDELMAVVVIDRSKTKRLSQGSRAEQARLRAEFPNHKDTVWESKSRIPVAAIKRIEYYSKDSIAPVRVEYVSEKPPKALAMAAPKVPKKPVPPKIVVKKPATAKAGITGHDNVAGVETWLKTVNTSMPGADADERDDLVRALDETRTGLRRMHPDLFRGVSRDLKTTVYLNDRAAGRQDSVLGNSHTMGVYRPGPRTIGYKLYTGSGSREIALDGHIMIHEFGHAVDFHFVTPVRDAELIATYNSGGLQSPLSVAHKRMMDEFQATLTDWRSPAGSKTLLSEYSLTNRHEWFAEGFAAYGTTPAALKRHHPATYAFMDQLMKGELGTVVPPRTQSGTSYPVVKPLAMAASKPKKPVAPKVAVKKKPEVAPAAGKSTAEIDKFFKAADTSTLQSWEHGVLDKIVADSKAKLIELDPRVFKATAEKVASVTFYRDPAAAPSDSMLRDKSAIGLYHDDGRIEYVYKSGGGMYAEKVTPQTIIHEFGHAVDDQYIKRLRKNMPEEYHADTRAMMAEWVEGYNALRAFKKGRGPMPTLLTEYSVKNEDEWFAESFGHYHTAREALRTTHPATFAWMEKLHKGVWTDMHAAHEGAGTVNLKTGKVTPEFRVGLADPKPKVLAMKKLPEMPMWFNPATQQIEANPKYKKPGSGRGG
jgi:Mlc titration factor MtfA (ptsG expression regulator)